MYILGMVLFILSWWASGAEAACSGSGTSWNCTAGTTAAQVNAMIASATDGATATFASGSYSWGGTVIRPVVSKGLTLICATTPPSSPPWGGATSGGCNISSSSQTFSLPQSGDTSKVYRISGFNFTYTGGSGSYFLWACDSGGCSNTISQFRFDHNKVTGNPGSGVLVFGENTASQYVYGVADHNYITSSGSNYFILWVNGAEDSTKPAPPLGTANNFFLEDNTMTNTSLTESGAGCTDHWGGSAIVWRYNTSTNCRLLAHGSAGHGFGPSNFEIYGNSITMNAGACCASGADFRGCYRCIHHQGANTGIHFNNQLTSAISADSSAMVFLHLRSESSVASSEWRSRVRRKSVWRRKPRTQRNVAWLSRKHQPGRDTSAAYKPWYAWNNTINGGKRDLTLDSVGGFESTHMVQNREWYNAVSASAQSSSTSPFNGTTGMGFGTRPTVPQPAQPAVRLHLVERQASATLRPIQGRKARSIRAPQRIHGLSTIRRIPIHIRYRQEEEEEEEEI